MSTHKALLGGAIVLSLVAAASGAAAGNGRGVLRIPLKPVNGSGQSGVAVLTPSAGGYTVVVKLRGRGVQLGEHDHIHKASCARYARIAPHPRAPTASQINAQLATVAVSLNDIVDGASKTHVTEPLSQVTRGGFSINVHQPGDPYTALVLWGHPQAVTRDAYASLSEPLPGRRIVPGMKNYLGELHAPAADAAPFGQRPHAARKALARRRSLAGLLEARFAQRRDHEGRPDYYGPTARAPGGRDDCPADRQTREESK